MTDLIEIPIENIDCPYCGTPHLDVDKWAIKPHKTHLCLHCNQLFEGTFKGVSHPTFAKTEKPKNVTYILQET